MAFIPEGAKDTFSIEYEIKKKITRTLIDLYKSYGYRQIETPTFEYYDTLNEIKNTVNKDNTLKIIDKDGKILVLRPDITMAIARMSAINYNKTDSYLKLCYNMQVFRTDKKDQLKERTQIGIEYLGRQNIYADGEVITLAIESLLNSGVTDFQIDIGQTEYIKALLEGIENHDEIKHCIANKNFISLSEVIEKLEIDNEYKQALKQIPFLYGNIDEILAGVYIKNKRAEEAIERLKYTYEMLKTQGYEKYISFDLGLTQDLDYYTGIIFKGYMKNFGKPVLSGGRYDYLTQQYKQEIKATGFGIDIDNLMEALENNEILVGSEQFTDYLVVGNNAETVLKKSKELRAKGNSVEYIIGMDTGEIHKIRNIKKVVEV